MKFIRRVGRWESWLSGVRPAKGELPGGRFSKVAWVASPSVDRKGQGWRWDTGRPWELTPRWDVGGVLEAQPYGGTGCGQKESRKCLRLGLLVLRMGSWAGEEVGEKKNSVGRARKCLVLCSCTWRCKSQFRRELYAQEGQ